MLGITINFDISTLSKLINHLSLHENLLKGKNKQIQSMGLPYQTHDKKNTSRNINKLYLL